MSVAPALLALLLLPVGNSSAADDAVAALDGRPIITEPDLTDYSAAQGCYGEGALTSRRASFMRLLEAAIADEAMRRAEGPAPDEEDLKRDAERIDRETRAPEILACIKAYFGADAARYRWVFVRPALIESNLRAFLANDREVQAKPRASVLEASRLARSTMTLEAAARAQGLIYSSATYTLHESTRAPGPAGLPWSPYEAEFIREHLQRLATGQLAAEPLETDYDFRTFRLLATDGESWKFEHAVARKVSQEEWFKTRATMKLRIRDSELRTWIQGIRGNPRLVAVDALPGK